MTSAASIEVSIALFKLSGVVESLRSPFAASNAAARLTALQATRLLAETGADADAAIVSVGANTAKLAAIRPHGNRGVPPPRRVPLRARRRLWPHQRREDQEATELARSRKIWRWRSRNGTAVPGSGISGTRELRTASRTCLTPCPVAAEQRSACGQDAFSPGRSILFATMIRGLKAETRGGTSGPDTEASTTKTRRSASSNAWASEPEEAIESSVSWQRGEVCRVYSA